MFRSSPDSSLSQKIVCKFDNFDDYVIAYDVIGHHVIGHSEIRTDNSELGLSGIANKKKQKMAKLENHDFVQKK